MDELDLAIAGELKLDARQSSRKLGAKLGASATTIARRLRRMVDANVLSFCCLSNPALLGFQSGVLLGLKTKPGKEGEVVQTLLQHGCVQSVNLFSGRYDLLAYAIFRDQRRQFRWMTEELAGVEDVLSYEDLQQLRMIKYSWGYEDGESALSSDPKPVDISESELELIRALEANPRENIDSLASKVHLTRQTAARRLQKLLDEDIVRIVSITDPVAMGFSVYVSILLKVQLDKLLSVADILVAHKRTTHVIIVGGTYNMLVAAAFRDAGEMSRFLRSEIGGMGGILDREILINIGRPKRSFGLVKALDYE